MSGVGRSSLGVEADIFGLMEHRSYDSEREMGNGILNGSTKVLQTALLEVKTCTKFEVT